MGEVNYKCRFKINDACEILGLSYQTLRYWRTQIDFLSSSITPKLTEGDLLALRIIKALNRDRHIPVRDLKLLPVGEIFILSDQRPPQTLSNLCLQVNLSELSITLVEPEKVIAIIADREIFSLDMSWVVTEHLEALSNLSTN
jgi:DNA-binding transcriptional MerR regulator